MKKIILAGLLNDKNLGDIVIADSSKFLYREATKDRSDVEFAGLDLAGYIKLKQKRKLVVRKFFGALNRVSGILGISTIEKKKQQHSRYYEPQIVGSSLIVIVGGGMIKYKYQNFWLYLSGLIDAAGRVGVPVVLNALGVEGYDEQDLKCQCLKEAMNRKQVKVITTRDDINTLQNLYLKGNSQVLSRQVADPAVFTSAVYGVERDVNATAIGVGIIRGNIFKDNDIQLSKKDLVLIYADILKELDKRSIEWKLFTNGLPTDVELVKDICIELGRNADSIDPLVPKTAKDLVQIISGFKGVIAARLHACIISYSLKIPAVGLVWNDKLSLFGECIGHRERFIGPERFSGVSVVNALQRALAEGYDLQAMEIYKETIKQSIDEILSINSITNN